MVFPTLPEILGGTQLMQPTPSDLSWKKYFSDIWYVTEKLAEHPREQYAGNKFMKNFSKIWDISIGIATDGPKVILYGAAGAYLLHQMLP